MMPRPALAGVLALTGLWTDMPANAQADPRRAPAATDLTILDGQTGKPVACNVYLRGADGQPVLPEGLPFWRDHFTCPGTAALRLAPGDYSYEIERGPEYRSLTGDLTVEGGRANAFTFQIERLTNMTARGWRSGEMHVHRPVADMELLMEAADLHVAPVITWWNARNAWEDEVPPARLRVRFGANRHYHVMAGEDEREGGALLYFGLERPLPIQEAQRDYPCSVAFLEAARKHRHVWVDIEKPFWWDVPLWLATGQVDSIGIANNHMQRSQMLANEAWGKPRDANRLPAPLGNAYWTQEIYYRILECGIRLPPSAGSASGVLRNPVGYNRVYAHVGGDTSYRGWWKAVRAGRTFVTNGPLLIVRAKGKLPGTVFSAKPGREFTVPLTASLLGNDAIDRLEVVQNGRVVAVAEAANDGRNRSVGELHFDASGWFLVRAIADNPTTFRFASTAPFYVAFEDAPRRVSRSAVQFFADWLEERAGRLKVTDPGQREQVLQYFEAAREFWADLLSRANAD
ncbi:MAG: CehA/McbA family metallohydrolase [Armatimonadota bacterium]